MTDRVVVLSICIKMKFNMLSFIFTFALLSCRDPSWHHVPLTRGSFYLIFGSS